MGNIIDAQDYLGNWHLAIVMKANNQDRDIHFLPYSNHKRDEVFSEADSNKIAPVFTNSEVPSDPEKAFIQLREYQAKTKKQGQGDKPMVEERKQSVSH